MKARQNENPLPPLEWIESLKKVMALEVDFIAVAPGDVGDKKAVAEFAAFIQGAVETVRRLIARGGSKEEAANTITSFEGSLPALHAGPEQQRLAVTHLYEVLSKENFGSGSSGSGAQ